MHRTIKRCRNLLSVVSVSGCALVPLLATTGAANGESRSLRAVVAHAVPSCTTAGLVVWLDTEGSGSAGGSYFSLEFTNVSGHTCTLGGYPGVSGVNLGGSRLGSAASRNASGGLHVITLHSATSASGLPPLGPTVTASVQLKIVDVGVYSSAQCRYVTAAGLRVYPPNQTTSKVVPFPFTGCARAGAVYLQVGAMTKATVPQ